MTIVYSRLRFDILYINNSFIIEAQLHTQQKRLYSLILLFTVFLADPYSLADKFAIHIS